MLNNNHSNMIIFILALRSRSRTTNPIITTGSLLKNEIKINSVEIINPHENCKRKSKHKLQRVSKRDVKILLNIGLMFLIFIIGWIPIYILPVISASMGSPLLDILGSFPSYSLLLNIILLYRYNHSLRQHIIMKFRRFIRIVQTV